jgi:ribosome recycling factor
MYNFTELKTELSKIEDWLKTSYSQISTGRANPALLDGVSVESYGTFQPIKNIASIATEDVRTMLVTPWDKGVIKDIERALAASGLPLSVSSDGVGIRISIPQLTTENKSSLVKLCKEKLEDARVSVRLERQKTDKDIDAREKAGDYAQDAKARSKDELQKFIDTTNKNLEAIFSEKEKAIMTV